MGYIVQCISLRGGSRQIMLQQLVTQRSQNISIADGHYGTDGLSLIMINYVSLPMKS